MRHAGRDRYSSLLRTLQAGQELPWQQPGRGRRLAWHPIAATLLRILAVGVLLYLAVTAALGIWRDGRVDVWAGPDVTVSSGQRLADCPLVGSVRDDLFPNWIRFSGVVYRLTDTIRPMGFQADPDFPSTGYSLGSMTLYRVLNTPDGQAGDVVAVKLENTAVGRVYRATRDCT
jgi:hypothetical protein